MESKSTLDYIAMVDEFIEANDFMSDAALEQALDMVVKLIVKPDVPQAKVVPLIVKLQAIASKLAIQAAIYTTIKKGPSGSENAYKKTIYYSSAEALNKLVDSLKYSARYTVI